MPRIIKVMAGDQEVNAIEMQFDIRKENWNEYQLLDGGKVRVKTTVSRILQVVDDAGNWRYNSDGSPFMVVYHKADVVSEL